jgi:hypothetical protein
MQHTTQLLEPRLTMRYELHWFRGPLAASYLAPLVGLSIFALGVRSEAYVFPTLVGLAGLSAPPLVHAANGDASGGLYALLGMLASAGAGALAGYTVGQIAPGGTAHGQASARDAAMLGVVGYVVWAVFDVAFFAYHKEPL